MISPSIVYYSIFMCSTYIILEAVYILVWYGCNYHCGESWYQCLCTRSIVRLPTYVWLRLPRVVLTGLDSQWTLSDTIDELNQWFLERTFLFIDKEKNHELSESVYRQLRLIWRPVASRTSVGQ